MALYILIAVILAYLLGSIPTAVWVGRIFYGIDIRTQGSGNAGATNTIRVLGLKAGLPVMVVDVFKGWLAVYIANFFYTGWAGFPDLIDFKIMLAVAAVVGHVFPVYVGFRGGKGIATLLGVGIALFPLGSLIAILVFALTLVLSSYVSLGSILAAVTFPFVEILILGHNDYPSLMLLSILVAVFVPITHRKNIGRLMRGEESKFKVKKKEEKEK
jgi:glycerol-3-phosphate acyltransferase PlsY